MDGTELHGRVAVVTGACGGIGSVYCSALARAGATVVAADIDLQRAETDASHAAFQLDVADPHATRELGNYIRAEFGRCDILVNNAAIYRGMSLASQMDVDIDYWRRVMAVNVDGALLCTQALAPLMIEGRWGRVINQTSVAAYQGFGGHYGVSKLALVALTQGFARELGRHNITVNAIAPGPVFTEATLETMPVERLERRLVEMPVSRRAQPVDLVGVLLFLVSEASSWVTGQTHVVDGGLINRL